MRAIRRYAQWIENNRVGIILASITFAVVAAMVAARISVLADFSYLLPQSSRSVKDLRAIEKRAKALGTTIVVIESADPVLRHQTAVDVAKQLSAMPALVAGIEMDEKALRTFRWDHRWQLAPLDKLVAAKDALKAKIDKAKLEANPLYVPLDDPDKPSESADQLENDLKDAEREKDEPGELIKGNIQIIKLRTAFSTGEIDRDRELVAAIERMNARIHQANPAVEVGVAGDAAVSLAEHDTILSGMLRATVVTVVLVLLAMGWFFRSALAIGALSWSLVVGTLATFAFTKLTLGYLNVATAFLSSIVIGNGINVGIIVTSRYVEELRAGRDGTEALANAMSKTIAATFAAALTASVAYASLVITVFRGFRHFGIIGGVGILLCWLSAYSILPAALSVARWLGMKPKQATSGPWLAKLLPSRFGPVAIGVLVLTLVAGGFATRLSFENNFRNLRSQSTDIAEAQRWMTKVDQAFGQGIDAGFVIAAPRREDVPVIEAKLRAANQGLFDRLYSFDDLLGDQPAKLRVLGEIRELLSGKDVDQMEDADRAEVLRLKPPDDLKPLRMEDIPDAIAGPLVEADGTRGRFILATMGKSYEVWDARDTVKFSERVRALGLPDDVHFGGASFVFADVIDAVVTDGPRATAAAALGAILIVLIVLGWNRFGLVTLVCGGCGTILMIGISALAGFKINFLDFVALPITIGIGIEYAVNIVTRAKQEGGHVGSTAGAVALCSYTTIVGYGSLLLSQNLGIRSFGLAAMLGELTCLSVALVLAPSLLRFRNGESAT